MLGNEEGNLGLFPIFLLTYWDKRKYFNQIDSCWYAIFQSLKNIMEHEF